MIISTINAPFVTPKVSKDTSLGLAYLFDTNNWCNSSLHAYKNPKITTITIFFLKLKLLYVEQNDIVQIPKNVYTVKCATFLDAGSHHIIH